MLKIKVVVTMDSSMVMSLVKSLFATVITQTSWMASRRIHG